MVFFVKWLVFAFCVALFFFPDQEGKFYTPEKHPIAKLLAAVAIGLLMASVIR